MGKPSTSSVYGDGGIAADFVKLSQDNWVGEGHVISTTHGADLYATYCGTCHGDQRQGGRPGTVGSASGGPAAFPADMGEAYNSRDEPCRLICYWESARIVKEKEDEMKGNERIIEKLNDLLADELTAINQYVVHSEMCANWGYQRLHEADEKRAIDEMKHAEKLIGRLLFLEGRPIVSNLKKINIGAEIEAQHNNDWTAEEGAIKAYNEGIRLATEVGDNGTRELLESILKDEEDHIDWLEAQLDQIEQMGIQNYLVEQID